MRRTLGEFIIISTLVYLYELCQPRDLGSRTPLVLSMLLNISVRPGIYLRLLSPSVCKNHSCISIPATTTNMFIPFFLVIYHALLSSSTVVSSSVLPSDSSEACGTQTLESLASVLPLGGQRLTPTEFLGRLGVGFCESRKCQALNTLTSHFQRSTADLLKAGDCELTVLLSDAVEAYLYRHNTTGDDQCHESITHLLNGCISKGLNPGRLVHSKNARFEVGFRPLQHYDSSLKALNDMNTSDPTLASPFNPEVHTAFCTALRPHCSRPFQSVECFICSLDDSKPHPGVPNEQSRYCKPKYVAIPCICLGS